MGTMGLEASWADPPRHWKDKNRTVEMAVLSFSLFLFGRQMCSTKVSTAEELPEFREKALEN